MLMTATLSVGLLAGCGQTMRKKKPKIQKKKDR